MTATFDKKNVTQVGLPGGALAFVFLPASDGRSEVDAKTVDYMTPFGGFDDPDHGGSEVMDEGEQLDAAWNLAVRLPNTGHAKAVVVYTERDTGVDFDTAKMARKLNQALGTAQHFQPGFLK